MGNMVFTIGREFGSNGHAVGEKLAERLGIPVYDKELLQRASRESGLCEEIFKNQDERPTNSFLYSLVMDTYTGGAYSGNAFLDMPLNHKVFLAQFDTIKKLAAQESCVIIGRCADYALEDHKEVINVFIQADLEERIRRVASRSNVSEAKAKDIIQKTDKQRASYYNYYTNKKWGDSRCYDITLNTTKVSVDDCVDLILQYYECFKKQLNEDSI